MHACRRLRSVVVWQCVSGGREHYTAVSASLPARAAGAHLWAVPHRCTHSPGGASKHAASEGECSSNEIHKMMTLSFSSLTPCGVGDNSTWSVPPSWWVVFIYSLPLWLFTPALFTSPLMLSSLILVYPLSPSCVFMLLCNSRRRQARCLGHVIRNHTSFSDNGKEAQVSRVSPNTLWTKEWHCHL